MSRCVFGQDPGLSRNHPKDLEQAVRLLDEHGVPHGAITRLPSFGIDVLPFDDPDGIQLELTTPAVPGPVTGA
jgi:hypothetical protein